MTFPVFDHPWYAEIIERFSIDVGAKDPAQVQAAAILSRALLASSCILAQAVDNLTEAVRGKTPDAND